MTERDEFARQPQSPITPELQAMGAVHNLWRINGDRVVFLDLLDPSEELRRGVPPSSVLEQPYLGTGLRHLQATRRPVTLLLTVHFDGNDFHALAAGAKDHLLHSPVSAIEASTHETPTNQRLEPPRLHPTNKWLRDFQTAQFPWLDAHDKIALPCEPVYEGPLAMRVAELEELFTDIGTNPVLDDQARKELKMTLYGLMSTYRSWGLVSQFGWWQQHPIVAGALANSEAPIPFTLGAAHKYEEEILQACGVPVTVATFTRDIGTNWYWEEMYPQHVADGFISSADYAVPNPYK